MAFDFFCLSGDDKCCGLSSHRCYFFWFLAKDACAIWGVKARDQRVAELHQAEPCHLLRMLFIALYPDCDVMKCGDTVWSKCMSSCVHLQSCITNSGLVLLSLAAAHSTSLFQQHKRHRNHNAQAFQRMIWGNIRCVHTQAIHRG